MTDHPTYPYSDGVRAVLGPDVTATADGSTITWQGATYRRDRGEIHCTCGGSAATAGDDGPSIEEAAADDRRWDLEKDGE